MSRLQYRKSSFLLGCFLYPTIDFSKALHYGGIDVHLVENWTTPRRKPYASHAYEICRFPDTSLQVAFETDVVRRTSVRCPQTGPGSHLLEACLHALKNVFQCNIRFHTTYLCRKKFFYIYIYTFG